MSAGQPPFRRYSTDELVAMRPSAAEREATRLPVIVLLDDVRSAMNVGLLFRLGDCLNITALWLGGITPWPGCGERATRRMEKTAVGGSLGALAWERWEDPVPAVRQAREGGWRVVCVEQGEGSVLWSQAHYGPQSLLIFGHERLGIREELLEQADEIVELPVRGVTNSLNVATCASAVLYEILRRRGPSASRRG